MNLVNQSATPNTPEISYCAESCSLDIKGKSFPENAHRVFAPLKDALTNLNIAETKSLTVNVELDVINSSTSIYLAQIFRAFAQLTLDGLDLKVIWTIDEDDEDTIELGNDLVEYSKQEVEFKYISSD